MLTLIREASFCGKWILTQRPTARQCAETLERCVLNVMSSSHPSPQDLGIYLCGRENGKILRARGTGLLKGNCPPDTGLIAYNSQRLTCIRCAQVQATWGPSTDREVDLGPTPN